MTSSVEVFFLEALKLQNINRRTISYLSTWPECDDTGVGEAAGAGVGGVGIDPNGEEAGDMVISRCGDAAGVWYDGDISSAGWKY